MNAKVALVFRGDARDPDAWSGVPSGIADALEELGVEVIPLDAAPSQRLNRLSRDVLAVAELARMTARGRRKSLSYARKVALLSSELAGLSTATVRWRLRRLPHIDGFIQLGSEFSLPEGLPLVSFDDMTVAQAVRSPCWDTWQALRPGSARGRRRRQAGIYRHAQKACVATPWAAASVRSDYGVPAQKVAVVGIGRNLAPKPVPRSWDKPRFLFVGRAWGLKNGPRVLRAFGQLRDRVPGAELDVVGNHPFFDLPGVRGHGRLRLDDPEHRLHLERLFESATCLVIPSCQDASGIAIAEAAAAGVPSIGTSVGGASFVIGRGGRVVDPEDERALLDAMAELAHAAVASELGARALARAPLFTWRAVAERLLRALVLPGVDVDGFAGFL